MTNGVLVRNWETHCLQCERSALGLAYRGTARDAAHELESYGWRDIKGWHCPDCAGRLDHRPTPPAGGSE